MATVGGTMTYPGAPGTKGRLVGRMACLGVQPKTAPIRRSLIALLDLATMWPLPSRMRLPLWRGSGPSTIPTSHFAARGPDWALLFAPVRTMTACPKGIVSAEAR